MASNSKTNGKSKIAYFPREPSWSLAAEMKAKSKKELLDILGPAIKMLKTKPRHHQLAALTLGLDNERWFFAMDMGTGKSKVGIDIFQVRKRMAEASCCLVTCPPIARRHWKREVQKHSDCTYAVVSGTSTQKMDLFLHAQADFIVVSHDWLTRILSPYIQDPDRGGIDQICDALERFDMIIVDEAHRLRGHDSKGFMSYETFLIDIPHLYLLSGTPVGNNYLGVWALYYLLDLGETYGTSFTKFLKDWFKVFIARTRRGNRRFPIYTLKKEKKQQFFERFWNYAIRWEEAECQDLPKKTYDVLPVGMTKGQWALYEKLLNKQEQEDEDVYWDLIRVTGGVHPELNIDKEPPEKLLAVEYLVEEKVVGREDSIIIWHWMQDEGRLIAKHLRSKFKGLAIGECRAEISASQKEKYLDQWAAGKCRVLVANPASIGIAVDLYETNIGVFYSNSRAYIDRVQSEKRIHREGQTRRTYYIDLVCEDTIDEQIMDNLHNARDAFAGFTRDHILTGKAADRQMELEGV